MIRGVLFDMDGVLVNNTQAHVKAFEIFCERYGVEDWQHKLQTAFGMGNDDIMRLILPEEIIREKGMKALGEEKEAIYREVYAPEIRPVRGLVELLEELRRRGIRCAVGSSGCRENVDFVLSNCGITDYFSCIVSGDRVTRCKPDPEIYLLAAEGLHLPSAECLVFEDARVGITAARRAGAGRIVALATTLPRHTLATQTEADVVIDDFASITLHINKCSTAKPEPNPNDETPIDNRTVPHNAHRACTGGENQKKRVVERQSFVCRSHPRSQCHGTAADEGDRHPENPARHYDIA